VAVFESAAPVLPSRCFTGLSQKTDRLKPAEGGYFPEGPPCQDLSSLRLFAISTHRLKQLNEPTLLTGRQTAYRFLWLRSFHTRVAVRLWLDGEKKMLTVKELSRDDDKDFIRNSYAEDESTPLLVDRTRRITPEEWGTFVKLFEESCFWEMRSTLSGPIANDGAWWVFEGVQEGHYHVAHRQSPNSGPYRDLGLYMLKLSGLPLDESKHEIY
jgi:hypothetical protein